MQQADHWSSHAFYPLVAYARNTSALPGAKTQWLRRKQPGCLRAPTPLGGLTGRTGGSTHTSLRNGWHPPSTVASHLWEDRFSSPPQSVSVWAHVGHPASERVPVYAAVWFYIAVRGTNKNVKEHTSPPLPPTVIQKLLFPDDVKGEARYSISEDNSNPFAHKY